MREEIKQRIEQIRRGEVPEGYKKTKLGVVHWISVLLPDAPDDVVQFLVNVSFEATKAKRKRGNK